MIVRYPKQKRLLVAPTAIATPVPILRRGSTFQIIRCSVRCITHRLVNAAQSLKRRAAAGIRKSAASVPRTTRREPS